MNDIRNETIVMVIIDCRYGLLIISDGLKKAFLGLAVTRCWLLSDHGCAAKSPVGSLLFPYQARCSAPMLVL